MLPPLTQGAVYIDGRLCAPSDATVSVYDRGFLYGDSVFEVLRTYGGRPFGVEEHVRRLIASCAKVSMALPWSSSDLQDEIIEAVKGAGFEESYVRLMVTRGTSALGLDLDLATRPTRVLLVHPLSLPPPKIYQEGVRLFVVDTPRATDGTVAAGAKSSNYLANLLALRDAKRHDAYEPLFVLPSPHGAEVLEGGTSNVFVVRGSTVVTPPEQRILAGITRRHVLDAAAGVGLAVDVRALPLAELLSADECFITSTVRELVPVVAVVSPGEEPTPIVIGRGVPGAVTRALHRAFRTRVGAPDTRMPWQEG